MRRCRKTWWPKRRKRSNRSSSPGVLGLVFIIRVKRRGRMKSAWSVCLILALATGLAAQTSTPPKTTKKKSGTITAADVQALKDAIASQQAALQQQQQMIQQLENQVRQKDQAVQQAQSAASDAASKADAAQATAAQQQQSVTEIKNDVADLKTNVTN